MKRLGRLIKTALWALLLLVLGLASPILYTETMCRPQGQATPYTPILPETDRRPESATLLTWPEWQIVHAYEDYAHVITTADPHAYAFLPEIGSFWSSLCTLSIASGPHGGVPWEAKQMLYTIGTSFTLELGLKAAYEETLGRLATLIRGPQRAELDDVTAGMATDYAAFLYQVPWYRWNFTRDAETLSANPAPGFRNWERRTAIGLEFRAKSAYAGVIAAAVAATGFDELTMRSVVTGMTPEALAQVTGIAVVETLPQGVIVETPRYQAFTDLALKLAIQGATFVEIAGNDDVMFTTLSDNATEPGALMDMARQGFGDYRHMYLIKVADLSKALLKGGIEHIHDY
jgi:hypothetical protein